MPNGQSFPPDADYRPKVSVGALLVLCTNTGAHERQRASSASAGNWPSALTLELSFASDCGRFWRVGMDARTDRTLSVTVEDRFNRFSHDDVAARIRRGPTCRRRMVTDDQRRAGPARCQISAVRVSPARSDFGERSRCQDGRVRACDQRLPVPADRVASRRRNAPERGITPPDC